MPSFETRRQVPFTALEMFDLVADVERYPEFLPLCEGLRVLSRDDDSDPRTLVAVMDVGYKAIRESFTSRVTLDRKTPSVRADLVEAFDDAAIDTALALGCQSLNLSRQGLSAAHVAAVKKAGLRCLVYTVNQPDEARWLAAWGVDGVFSDRPDLLLPVSACQNPA